VKASIVGNSLALAAMLFSPDGARELSDSMEDSISPDLAPSAAEDAGKRLAEKMLASGAGALLGK
jgi:porphobilinogen deaminase